MTEDNNADPRDIASAALGEAVEAVRDGIASGAIHPHKVGAAVADRYRKRAGEVGLLEARAKAQPAGDIIGAALARSRRRYMGDERPVPVPWKVYADALGGGYWPGVHVLVSGTGAGKSTLAADVALHAAREGHPVGIVSLELGAEEQALRLLSSMAGVWFSDVITGRSLDAIEKAEEHANDFRDLPITIAAAGPMGWTADDLAHLWADMEGHREVAKRDGKDRTPLIIIDYLQLVASPEGTTEPIRERIGRAAYKAHGIANAYGAACLLVSSIARSNYALVGADNAARQKVGVRLTQEIAKREENGKWVNAYHVDEHGIEDRNNPIRYHRLLGSDALVGLGKEAGEVEFSAVSVTAIGKVQDMRNARALMLAKNRFGSAAWTALDMTSGTFKPGNAVAVAEASNAEGKAKE